ncbi:hypothetical protein [uncultured Thiodictyon sp.]|uniref:hypothetical protein n=1 Tax=uncultured Thiodictyon sp. TaxID=1846217 RepID=UPI0025F08A85|nr:hypothetical protein [uncultured Thiodictyon sp.]
MAWIVAQIAEKTLQQSPIATGLVRFVSEGTLDEKAKTLKPKTFPGKKRKQETALFYRPARALARMACDLAAQSGERVVAVLFHDADGTRSARRGLWQDKWDSMINGFNVEGFHFGVPMIPKPKSEAWLLCALKANQPYQHCARIEDESGNDSAANNLKTQLKNELSEEPTSSLLAEKVGSGEVDVFRIDMPSFRKFRERLEYLIVSAKPQ